MHITIVQFLAQLADSIVIRNPRTEERLSGLLKIYQNRDGIPRRQNCIAFGRIAEHLRNECIRIQSEENIDLSFDEADLRRAIASFVPSRGSGRHAHVVIRSETRKQFDSYRSEAQRKEDNILQDSYLAQFVATGVVMPRLNVSVDGVITTV